ncbi:hypothetical protein HY413_03565 [Candidatus Kaiserbacteria bacterium]|nr:hypothetical protein [Candidatus Kaiserbacteria bacterium]
MGVTPLTVTLPEIVHDLLCEVGAITQIQIDAQAKKLPPIQSGDIVKGQLAQFGQQLFTLGKQKEAQAEDAVTLGNEEDEVRFYTQMDTLYALLNLSISSMLTAEEVCDDRFDAKICKNYQIILRTKEPDEAIENDTEDDEDEKPAKLPNRKKMN